MSASTPTFSHVLMNHCFTTGYHGDPKGGVTAFNDGEGHYTVIFREEGTYYFRLHHLIAALQDITVFDLSMENSEAVLNDVTCHHFTHGDAKEEYASLQAIASMPDTGVDAQVLASMIATFEFDLQFSPQKALASGENMITLEAGSGHRWTIKFQGTTYTIDCYVDGNNPETFEKPTWKDL